MTATSLSRPCSRAIGISKAVSIQQVRANYLASPMLVVCYALAGKMSGDLTKEPIGYDKKKKPVYLSEIWPSPKEIADTVRKSLSPAMFRSRYADVFSGGAPWKKIKVDAGKTYRWDDRSTYVKNPPYFEGMRTEPAPINDIKGARILGIFADSITTDHISPAGSIKKDSPAGKYLMEHGVQPADFNSYGARRGNHEVMMRGTFANIRIRNEMLGGKEGGNTLHYQGGTGTEMPIYDAAMKYQAAGTPTVIIAGKEYGSRLLARLRREGSATSRHPRGDRRKLRAHPPLEPRGHGHPAARVRRRQRAPRLWVDRSGNDRHPGQGGRLGHSQARDREAHLSRWPHHRSATDRARRYGR